MKKSAKSPQSHVFYRRAAHDHPLAVEGKGIAIYDEEGRRYLDASGGALVVNIGHGIQEIVDAIAEQAAQVAYIHPTQFTSRPMEAYANALAPLIPLPEARFYPLSSGSEAVEAAIKFARQVQIARGQSTRYLTISRWGAYHGATLGALAATGKPKMRRHFLPMFLDLPHIPPPYCYRCPFGETYPDCGLRCAEALEEEIKKVGPQNVSAFIAESVGGATLGAIVPPPGYWPRIREICDRYEILLIADEVMSGMGRTGKWFAIQHWEVTPDLITLGKGTASGYFPLALLAVREELRETITAGDSDFVHGGTFSHHAVGAAAGLATLKYLDTHDLVPSVERKGVYLKARLDETIGGLSCVGDIRGIGLMWAVEFVADRETKTPYPPEIHFSQRVADAAFARGLIIYPGSGSVDGESGDHLMLGPPFVITEAEMDKVVDLLYQAIQAVGDTIEL